MWKGCKLLATLHDGKAHLDALLDDYSFLLAPCSRCWQADLDAATSRGAEEIAEVLMADFQDNGRGRLLLHRARPREADPSSKPGHDKRHAVGQRHLRFGAWPGSRPHRLDARSRRASAERTLTLLLPRSRASPRDSRTSGAPRGIAHAKTTRTRDRDRPAGDFSRGARCSTAVHHLPTLRCSSRRSP